jgi:peroxiredoxin (alkyl hydroperoxide reductase subunit C)
MSEILAGTCLFREPVLLDQPAADFTAEAYFRGERARIKLSTLREKWVVLFFYTADFTFV